MNIIIDNQITQIVASSAHASFPAINLLNESIKKGWKAENAGVTYATLDVSTKGTTGGLGLVGIVADSAVVTISDPSGIVWQNVEWGNVDWQAPSASDVAITAEWIKHDGDTEAQLWVSFPQFDVPVTIRIELRKSATNPYPLSAGALRCGRMISIVGLRYPIQEGLIDLNFYRELSNGVIYTGAERGRKRTFSGEINCRREDYFYQFMRDIARQRGRQPLMVQLADNDDNNFVIYGRLSTMPSGTHYHKTYSVINFELIEVV